MTVSEGAMTVALDDIDVAGNVRELDDPHVAGLARSIALRGLIVPLVVRPRTPARRARTC
jgi:ParB-like chromosome segregation protein Spo0J